MALTLVKEDGTGLANANTYADVADGNAYFEGHLYAGAWELSADDRKAEALVMATRVIDAEFRFNGWRANDDQALQWPRINCPDPDRAPWAFSPLLFRTNNFVPSNVVPSAVVSATFEVARALMIEDRTVAPPGEGIQTTTTGAGATFNSTTYSKVDTRPVIAQVAQVMLARYGNLVSGRSGAVRLTRA